MKFPIILTFCGLMVATNAFPKLLGEIQPRKIVGGENARQGEFPYQLSLHYNGRHICGASLAVVNKTQVAITAAHCVLRGSATSYSIIAGDLNRLEISRFEQERQVLKIISHENYSSTTYENDIAILKFGSPFNLTRDVSPIPLPTKLRETYGQVVVTGWGATSSGGPSSVILQKVEIPVISDSECQQAYFFDRLFPSQICAGLLGEGGRDSCQGDSGGPLRAVNGGYLAGIVSWGYGCADPKYPGVNTEVSYFIDWLETNV